MGARREGQLSVPRQGGGVPPGETWGNIGFYYIVDCKEITATSKGWLGKGRMTESSMRNEANTRYPNAGKTS